MSVEIGRIRLIPAKGLLEKMKPVIESKVATGDVRYIGNFELPSSRFPFKFECIVEDNCNVCPLAVEVLSEIAIKFENVAVEIYNASYVEPPWSIDATPAFRINEKVTFTGMPIDPSSISSYMSWHVKEAYAVSHPKSSELLSRLEGFAKAHGFKRCPSEEKFIDIVVGLLKNIDLYGQPYCPCRPVRGRGELELNRDRVCPCPYSVVEVKSKGSCLCGLFWSSEAVERYIRERLERYGWVLKEIDEVKELLDKLKEKVVVGNHRRLCEAIMSRVIEIITSLS